MAFWTVLFLFFGFLLLIKSADVLVDGAAGLARKFGIPKVIIGLTLVAFGTSAPEGTVSLLAAIQGSADISLGNVIGSNIANIALVLGFSAFLRNITVRRLTVTKEIPLSILAVLAIIFLGYDEFFQSGYAKFNVLGMGDGLILAAFFVVFLYYVFGDLRSTQVQEEEIEMREKEYYRDTYWYLALLFFSGLAGVLVGGKLIVDNAVIIAQFFGVSEALIGLTIVALGTSLPELVTAIVATRRNEDDIAVGSIMGSNIFNVFLVLAVTSIIHPLRVDVTLIVDILFALFITLLFYIFLIRNNTIGRKHGIALLFCYALYLTTIGLREPLLAFVSG